MAPFTLREFAGTFVITLGLVNCSGEAHSDPFASGGSGASGGGTGVGGASTSGGFATIAATGGASTGGTFASGGEPGAGGTLASGGTTSAPITSAHTGGVGPTGTCPANVANQPCGSTLLYCITNDKQTCACDHGSWYCFGP